MRTAYRPREHFLNEQLAATPMAPLEWPEGTPDDGLYATHEGYLTIGDLRLHCYQLSDGSRVIDADDVARVLFGVDR